MSFDLGMLLLIVFLAYVSGAVATVAYYRWFDQ